MRRRRFIELLGATSLAGVASADATAASGRTVSTLAFPSAGSLYGADGGPLTDDALVPVWAADSASNADYDGDGDAFVYWDWRQIPLVADDGGVVGFGSMLVHDAAPDGYDNEAFLLNVWDAKLGGGGTVLWDHSHDQYYTLDKFSGFEAAAESAGYDVRPTWDLTDDLPGADAVVITSPGYWFWDADLDALAEFVADGGVVFLHDQSDYNDYDASARLTEITERLGAAFRFNDDQVVDDESNAGASYRPVTSAFSESEFPYFDGSGGGGGGNEAPTASLTASDTSVATGASVDFDGSRSTDADGAIASYDWTFGDGASATGAQVSHAWESAGDYAVTLTVTDDDGATAQAATTVSVSDEAGDAPRKYDGEVTSVADGDTCTVRFDGSEKEIRVLGIDTPEKEANRDAERPPEWEGIESSDVLADWGADATTFIENELADESVKVYYDENADRTDPFGRHLMYIEYDADGDGVVDANYNRRLVETGHARVYDSMLAKHDDFLAAEDAARANSEGLWTASDPDAAAEIRDEPVSEVFVPRAARVATTSGAIADSRVPVRAESSASPAGAPLVGVDEANNLALVGGLIVNEDYEAAEGFGVDTSSYGNFPFLTNLLDSLSSKTGDVVIEGGHGQFGADAALSAEDAAYYQRYLEGQDVGFQQYNDLPNADLSDAMAVVVTTPVSGFTGAETSALASFRDDGGAVVLLGSAAAAADARANLNDLAIGLGSDLQLRDEQVTDYQHNLDGDETLCTTTAFDTTVALFGPYT
jgi:endonuclease YncB( thermonuclease family)